VPITRAAWWRFSATVLVPAKEGSSLRGSREGPGAVVQGAREELQPIVEVVVEGADADAGLLGDGPGGGGGEAVGGDDAERRIEDVIANRVVLTGRGCHDVRREWPRHRDEAR
jgi:hypothetical protein